MAVKKDQIIYALVAKDSNVIMCEQALASGNFPQISQIILKKHIKKNDKRMLSYDQQHMFHYLNEEGITYLVLTDSNFNKRVSFLFLQDMRDSFRSAYDANAIKNAIAYSMKEWSESLKEKMIYYNTNQSVDRLATTKQHIETVKGIMQENLEKIMERGEKIEILVQKSNELGDAAVTYRRSSNSLRRTFCMRNFKMTMILCGIVTTILVILIMVIVAAVK